MPEIKGYCEMAKYLLVLALFISGCETMEYTYMGQSDYYATMECYSGGSKVDCASGRQNFRAARH